MALHPHGIAFRAANTDYDLLQRAVENYRRSFELARQRRLGGIAIDLDVAQAEAQLRATEAELPETDLRRTRLCHAVATLCGQPAVHFAIAPALPRPATILTVPVSLPSQLLEQRPDIAAVERRMAAANADVGVAQTAFYPSIRLQGLAGLQSIDAGTLFNWPSRLWAVGPSLEWPVFTGGRNRAQLAAARAAYEELVAAYRQTVLVAFQEVEDQLAAQRLLAAQDEAARAALAAERRALEATNNRYRAGLITYLDVAITQAVVLARERMLVQLRSARMAASVGLIKALGGGWGEDARDKAAH